MNWITNHCDPAISPKCPGHQGWEKYPDCLTPALMDANDVETGSVDWDVWVCLIIQEKAETIESDTCPLTIPADTYWVIMTDDRGHVSVSRFDTAQDAQNCFDGIEAAYGAWLAGNDEREYAIVSSTGRTGQ